MAASRFRRMGLVHIANRIVQHRPISAGERLSLRVWTTPGAPHPRGTQFSICSEARVRSELVWEEISTNLSRGQGSPDAPAPAAPPSSTDLPVTATWRLRGDLGRRYAAVSKDFNPIHIHSLSARAFGFKSAIAHGMWTKARCLAALGPEVPDACTVEVAFKRPILLPSTVKFAERGERRSDPVRRPRRRAGPIAPGRRPAGLVGPPATAVDRSPRSAPARTRPRARRTAPRGGRARRPRRAAARRRTPPAPPASAAPSPPVAD